MGAPRVNCPTCGRELKWNEQFPFRPFCSERCRMVDLGAWFAEERRLPGDTVDELQARDDLPKA
jgi:endogenous inhibitor of DNA gyrase (YacG/DUF329 family)